MILERQKNIFIVTALMLSILVASMDNTIVVTAMGTIVADLGNLEDFVWVISAYMITEMAGMPIFGKLSDMYGRKRFFIFGLTIFMVGSALCGTADSLMQLGIYRIIQGIGGGAIVPIAFTIAFDIFPPEKRGMILGLLGSVFGISSIIGPLLGAYITDYISWHWVFYVNIPIGFLAILFIAICYKESSVHEKQKIDWFGSVTLIGAVSCLVFALEFGGEKYAWDSSSIISLLIGFIIFSIAFLFIETRVEEPIISLKMFKDRLFATTAIIALLYGATLIVPTVYTPLFIQGVYGGSATKAGLLLIPMMLATAVTSQLGGYCMLKWSYRNVMIGSSLLTIAGILLLSTIAPLTNHLLLISYMIIVGAGIGFSFPVLGSSAIHSIDVSQRGAATSTTTFIRLLGTTVSVTVFGIIQRTNFQRGLDTTSISENNNFYDTNAILSEDARSLIPHNILEQVTNILSNSISHTFLWALIPASLALMFIFLMGNAKLNQSK
ncbi:MDR family MFS transporter [Bacillus wiedmannii]|uniref:MDR family MFS transporter n=1 Tax=Bacillus wiedmannii TaxID=1890302 RepID=UPI000D161818|nr:MDR family MFS transporter [Bacillus wiedmannii]PTC10369.1 MFS transporter [Bacillus wiedmannii]